MIKKKLILILFVLIISPLCKAQVTTEFDGGSPYSIFGIGDVNYYTSTRTYSMGILGTSLFGNYVNTYNPAALTKLQNTIITTNFNYGFLRSSNNVSQNEISDGNVLGLNIGIPFDQDRGWTLSLGFNPATLVNYKILVKNNVGGQDYTQTYSGNGGLSRISTGMSYNLFRKISIGFEYDFAFGDIQRLDYINFNNISYTNTLVRKETDMQKSFLKGGIIFEIGKLINNLALRDLSLGLFYQSGMNLNSNQNAIYRTSTGADTVALQSGKIEIPDSYSIGISNNFNNKFIVSGDVLFQDWSNYSEFGISNINFTTSYRAGLGLEVLSNPNSISIFGRMSYRFGGFYEKAFYRVAN
ncbi:MAG: hypothetical protein LH629_08635, partial [Ignavibacteria bacterium]|nr:hypothetical protein [Ignavibacteria bacterium]